MNNKRTNSLLFVSIITWRVVFGCILFGILETFIEMVFDFVIFGDEI